MSWTIINGICVRWHDKPIGWVFILKKILTCWIMYPLLLVAESGNDRQLCFKQQPRAQCLDIQDIQVAIFDSNANRTEITKNVASTVSIRTTGNSLVQDQRVLEMFLNSAPIVSLKKWMERLLCSEKRTFCKCNKDDCLQIILIFESILGMGCIVVAEIHNTPNSLWNANGKKLQIK